ncbi:uncharacterized protein LOC127250640 [Andrographis paniculata]|uniref:uncharacterized protein LOC127250640 n=1 Tax=Andrographis paniculata TaxID=175694 RepID=UPI0021E8CAAC|nr:uncharacterized protein LOC127250640 [Andrographis paniculata]
MSFAPHSPAAAEGRSPLERDPLRSVGGFSELYDSSKSAVADAFSVSDFSGSTTANTNPMVLHGFALDSEPEVDSSVALVRARRSLFQIPSSSTQGRIEAAPLSCSSTRGVVIDMLRIYCPLGVEPLEYRVGGEIENHLVNYLLSYMLDGMISTGVDGRE